MAQERKLKSLEDLREMKVTFEVVNERFVGDRRPATPGEILHVKQVFRQALEQGNVTINGKPIPEEWREEALKEEDQ